MKQYKETAKCIWCGQMEPKVSFATAPHILPRRLGGTEIGFDVCDECNHYFGTAPFGHSCISPWQYNHVIQRS